MSCECRWNTPGACWKKGPAFLRTIVSVGWIRLLAEKCPAFLRTMQLYSHERHCPYYLSVILEKRRCVSL